MDAALQAALGVLAAYLRQIVLVLGPVALLGVLLYCVIRHTQRLFQGTFGWKPVIYTTGWLGTPVHELSHAFVGKLFGIKLLSVKLFDPDPRSGVLGHVTYQQPPRHWTYTHQWIGTFFMGIAPLLIGSGLVALAFTLLIQPEVDGRYADAFRELSAQIGHGAFDEAARALGGVVRTLFAATFAAGWATRWQTWVFLYLALAIGAHLAPSRADMEGGWPGFLVLLGVGLLANVIATLLGADPAAATTWLQHALGPLVGVLFLVLLINTGWLLVALVLSLLGGSR